MTTTTIIPLLLSTIQAVDAAKLAKSYELADSLRYNRTLQNRDAISALLTREMSTISVLIDKLLQYMDTINHAVIAESSPLLHPGDSFRDGKIFAVNLDERGYVYHWEEEKRQFYIRQEELTNEDMTMILTARLKQYEAVNNLNKELN